MSRKPLIIANWKMNLGIRESKKLASAVVSYVKKQNLQETCDLVLCPAATALFSVGKILKDSGIKLGAQDCHLGEQGAHTGDISADMLKDVGVEYVIVGHSERRDAHFETSEQVKNKAASAHKAGLISVICVGESIGTRERSDEDAIEFTISQLKKSLPSSATEKNTVIAYEPVWAIGTGRIPTSSQIKNMHDAIAKQVGEKFSIIYGGSINIGNAGKIFSISGVSGGLIGGASLSAKDFNRIISYAGKVELTNGRK